MEYPRLSIITPSYNQAAYLEQAMRSVVDQRYRNLEYIVIDGGSSDGSVDIIRRHRDHLAYWVSEPDRGQSHAINKGLERATGDWIAWLNSDDYYLPGAFEAIAGVVSGLDDSIGFVFGRGIRVAEDGNEIGMFWPRKPVFDRNALLYGADYVLQPTAFIKRALWQAAGPLDESLRYCMDYDLWLRLSAMFGVAPVDHPVAVSREHGGSKTATGGIDRWYEIHRMVCRHSGGLITPGVVLYLVETLRQITRAAPIAPVFGAAFHAHLDRLWSDALAPVSAFSRPGDWLPIESRHCPPEIDAIHWMAANLKPRARADALSRHAAGEGKLLLPDDRADWLRQIYELNEAVRYWERQAEERLRQVEARHEAARFWKSLATDLLRRCDTPTKLRHAGGRIAHAIKTRAAAVNRLLTGGGKE